MRVRLLPYKMGSVTGRDVARAMGIKRIYNDGRGLYRYKRGDLIINWGCSQSVIPIPSWAVLNNPELVRITSSKALAFRFYRTNNVTFCMPESTESVDLAREWATGGDKVYCRKILNGHSGNGIVVASTPEEVVYAPLYTKRFKAKYEYRVHVFKGQVIDVSKKGLRHGVDIYNPLIRNHANGYVFIRGGVDVPDVVRDTAIQATTFYGLDFAAVDIGWHPERGACCYELNSAPGGVHTTIDAYVRAFTNYARRFRG